MIVCERNKLYKRIVFSVATVMLFCFTACSAQQDKSVDLPAPFVTETLAPVVTQASEITVVPEITAVPVPTSTDTPAPTAAPGPTNTPKPTATNTPVPTNTPEPTATNTPTPVYACGADEIDCEPPKLTPKDIYIIAGDNISYKSGMTVSDNVTEKKNLKWTYNKLSSTQLKTTGDYKVDYTVTDEAGNTAYGQSTVHVRVLSEVTAAEVNKLADSVLKSIIKPGMTDREKMYAIYTRCKIIAYTDSYPSYDKDGYKYGEEGAAYMGLRMLKGDCFAFAATAKLLLERAGFENMIVASGEYPVYTAEGKLTNDIYVHFYNMVKTDGQWLYFDTTPFLGFSERLFLVGRDVAEQWDTLYWPNWTLKHPDIFRYTPHDTDFSVYDIEPAAHVDLPEGDEYTINLNAAFETLINTLIENGVY